MESNSAFISYRRSVSAYLARAIFQDLRANGIDAFMDVESMYSGQFDKIIMGQIAARPYFLLLLTPGTLERCKEPNDWLRHEIERAMKLRRQIVLLHTPTFEFTDINDNFEPSIAEELRLYNAIDVPHNYFDAAMNRLRTRFLKPIDLPTTETPKAHRAAVQEKIEQVAAQQPVTPHELSAQEHLERAIARRNNSSEEIADYDEAIRLNPLYAEAFYHRGKSQQTKFHWDMAIADYSEAIRLNPKHAKAHYRQGIIYYLRNNLDAALANCSTAIDLNPNYAKAYQFRGSVLSAKGDLDGAIADYEKAIRLDPKNGEIYYSRGIAYEAKGLPSLAVSDYEAVLELAPNHMWARNKRQYIAEHRATE